MKILFLVDYACNRPMKLKKTVDNTGANVVILICWSLGILCRNQRVLGIPERKAGRQHMCCS
jgi:hypothetical protein